MQAAKAKLRVKTSILVDPDLWSAVKQAAQAWGEREGIGGEGQTSKWVARWLTKGIEAERMERRVGRKGVNNVK